MEHMGIDITVLTIIMILLISKFLNDKFKMPLPHSLIILSFLIYHFYPGFLNLSANKYFDEILFLLIPVILLVDAIHLKFSDIKKHWLSIFYLAVVALVLSVIIGSLSYYYGLLGTGLSIGIYVSLFAILNATDAVSVNSIFAQFPNVSHDKKILIEGESLGNDAVAFSILMLIGIPWAINSSFDFLTLPITIIVNVGAALIIGAAIGYIFYFITMLFNEEKEEFFIMMGVAFASFVTAEILHFAGIFSLIVAVITFKTLIDKNIEIQNNINSKDVGALTKYKIFSKRVTTKERHTNSINMASNLAYIATIVLFVSMTEMINVEDLLKYKYEILIAFFITTFTRFFTVGIFSLLSNKIKYFTNVGFDGWIIISLAGIKGGLSIIMVHALTTALGNKHQELALKIESIVIGVIILSIFVYGFLLLLYMLKQSKNKGTKSIT